MAIHTLNILSIIIRIRLQHVGGSDKVCVYSSSIGIIKPFCFRRME